MDSIIVVTTNLYLFVNWIKKYLLENLINQMHSCAASVASIYSTFTLNSAIVRSFLQYQETFAESLTWLEFFKFCLS